MAFKVETGASLVGKKVEELRRPGELVSDKKGEPKGREGTNLLVASSNVPLDEQSSVSIP